MFSSGPSFEEIALPHLDAAYNYARWLSGNGAEAEDVVQEAYLRAFRYFRTFDGRDPRAWLLAIVRNTYHSRRPAMTVQLDVTHHDVPSPDPTPEATLIQDASHEAVRRAVEALPTDFREAIVLREFEGMSYKEIAAVTGVPIGTVMSRLARARERVSAQLADERRGAHGLR